MLKNYLLNNKYSNYIYLFIFYSLAHIWILFLSNSLFWDDWAHYDSSKEIINLQFLMTGRPFFGFLHNSLLQIGLPIYRYLTFIFFFITSIFLDKILERSNILKSDMRFGLCLLYLTTPFYIARVTIVCFQYTFCLFLFFAAWFLMDRFRLISIFLFLISFTTNSLLVFYCLPIIEDFFIKFKSLSIRQYIKKNIILLLLPFSFYLFQVLKWKPFGTHEGYHSNFAIKNIFTASISQLIHALKLESKFIIFLPLLVLLISYIFYRFIFSDLDTSDKKNMGKLFVLGFISLISAVFPYWILNYSPSFFDWSSRHQLLMPLGVAIITISIILNFEVEGRRILLSLFISIFLIINISNYSSLISDHIKQNQIIEVLKNKVDVKNSDFVIFEDETKNALDRYYRFYEWVGILNQAYPDKNIIGLNNSLDELNSIDDIFQSNCQHFYGIKKNNIPNEVKISKLKITYSSLQSPISNIKNIFYRLRNFNTKPIEITIIDKYQIDKNDFFKKRTPDLMICKASKNII